MAVVSLGARPFVFPLFWRCRSLIVPLAPQPGAGIAPPQPLGVVPMSRSYVAGSVAGGALGTVTAAALTWIVLRRWVDHRLGTGWRTHDWPAR